MSKYCDQDYYIEENDEDKILAGLSAEELQQLQNEMDDIAPDMTLPVGMRQTNASIETPQEDKEGEPDNQEFIDEDVILATLSFEELKQLQIEIEVIAPDDRVPVGMRQKDQTDKPPTGSFDHRSLVDYLYWEKECKRLLEEERIPTTLLPSQNKREKDPRNAAKEDNKNIKIEYVYEEKVVDAETEDHEDIIEQVIEKVKDKNLDVEVGETDQKIEPSKTEPQDSVIIMFANSQPAQNFSVLQKEREAYGAELNEEGSTIKIKQIDQIQHTYVPSNYENWIPKKEERVISKLNIPKLALGDGFIKKTARPSGNDTNLESTLDKIRNNICSITEINLNNIENMPKEMLLAYIEALKKNKHVKTFSISNTGADDTVAFSLANMLRENRSISTLNIESNFITGKGIIAIMRCLQFNENLTELRFHNQRHMLGHHAEMEMARLLKANNTLLKVGYHFELPGPRMVVTNLLSRNLDQQRQQRKEEQRLQQIKEQRQIMEVYEDHLNLPAGLLEMLAGYIPGMERLCAAQGFQNPSQSYPEQSILSILSKPCHLLHKPYNPTQQHPPSSNMLKDLKLKKTSKCCDPLLDLTAKEEKKDGRANIQLRSTPKQTNTASKGFLDDRANLKDVINALKPVPRRRQPPKAELTPRDLLLNEIRESNVAYLKAAQAPVSIITINPEEEMKYIF